jgi:ActR/RegA family two-component response regulator
MSGARILVVDDNAAFRYLFYDVFGTGEVEWVDSAESVRQRVSEGATWVHAFVDFDLSNPFETGLTVMSLLQGRIEQLHGFTQTGASSRLLFIAAAKAWFGAVSNLDKGQMDEDSLRRYMADVEAGKDPTPTHLRAQMERAHLIDSFFAKEYDVTAWRHLVSTSGDHHLVQKLMVITGTEWRAFRSSQTQHVQTIQEALFGKTFTSVLAPSATPGRQPDKDRANVTLISAFGCTNSQFFTAPDIDDVVIQRFGHTDRRFPTDRPAAFDLGRK